MTDSSEGWIYLASIDEFQGQRQLVRSIESLDILLCRFGGEIAAIHNRCSHLGKPLQGGRLMGTQITCPFHGACFDLKTGAAVSGPAVYGVHTFPVRIDEGRIFVNLDRRPNTVVGYGSPSR